MSGSSWRQTISELLSRKERECLSYRSLEEETGISRHTLAAWASRYRRELSTAGDRTPDFVEVVVREPFAAEEVTPIEIVLGAHVLRVRRGFDPETLRRVLAALSRPC